MSRTYPNELALDWGHWRARCRTARRSRQRRRESRRLGTAAAIGAARAEDELVRRAWRILKRLARQQAGEPPEGKS